MKKQFRNRGLPSLKESAIDRHRQIVTGRAKVGGGIPPNVFLWGLAFLVVGGFIYFRNSQAELEDQKAALFTKQRATRVLLGPKLIPLRDEIESHVAELSRPGKDVVSELVNFNTVFSSPSIYLRVRLEAAKQLESLRKTAGTSLRDGFTSCLLSDPSAGSMTSGKSCRESTECNTGEFCNEYKHCSRPSSPYSMRLLYRGLLILSDEWTKEVREAGSEYTLLAYERSLDSVTQVDIPIAIDVYQRAKYAWIVLDEDPKDGLPVPYSTDFESPEERVQRVAHDARVGVWDLANDKLVLRLQARAEGELRAAGTRPLSQAPYAEAARARMANGCGLALSVKAKIAGSSQ